MDSDSKSELEEQDSQKMLETKVEGKDFNPLCLVIKISKEEWKDPCEPWKLCLTVKLMGKTLGV